MILKYLHNEKVAYRSSRDMLFSQLGIWERTMFDKNKFPIIPSSQWLFLLQLVENDKKLQIELAEYLAGITGQCPVPLAVHNLVVGDIYNDYIRLENYNAKLLKSEYKVRGNYKQPISEFAHQYSLVGLNVANYFMNEAMEKVGTPKFSGGYHEAWGKVNQRRILISNIIRLKLKKFDLSSIRCAIRSGGQLVSNFRPTVAKAIYNQYSPNGTVVDLSSGFGGRFVGFWSSVAKTYYGVDPNTNLIQPYKLLTQWLSKNFPKKKKFKFYCSPAEDLDFVSTIGKDSVDLVFTSPPYFSTEKYSTENTQSWVRYPTIKKWKYEFLFKTLKHVTPILKKGGHCIINICDNEMRGIKVCDDMCREMGQLGYSTLPAIKLLLASRPGSGHEKIVKVAEPIWVFRKE